MSKNTLTPIEQAIQELRWARALSVSVCATTQPWWTPEQGAKEAASIRRRVGRALELLGDQHGHFRVCETQAAEQRIRALAEV